MNIRQLLFALLAISTHHLRAQEVWFQDDFNRTDLGSAWRAVSGAWVTGEGIVTLETRDYDRMLASTFWVYDVSPYRVDLILRGPRAGVFFCMDDSTTKSLSHMVRFDEQSMLAGYFTAGGEFVATGTFQVRITPGAWTRLTIDIVPDRGTYSVSIDGVPTGDDQQLVYRSGYIGLQASEGRSQFDKIAVTGRSPYAKPGPPGRRSQARFQHIRFVRGGKDNVVIHNPELGLFQAYDLQGRLLRQDSPGHILERVQEVKIGDRTYDIAGSAVLIRRQGKPADTIRARLMQPSALLADGDSGLFVADGAARAIHRFSPDGAYLSSFTARAIGGFIAPRGIDRLDRTSLVVADYSRVVVVPTTFRDPEPDISIQDSARATVTWARVSRDDPAVECARDGEGWRRVEGEASPDGAFNTARLEGLRPLSRYRLRVFGTLHTIPPAAGEPRVHRFATPPGAYRAMSLTRLPLLCMVYRMISFRDRYPASLYPNVPGGRRLSDDDIAGLQDAVRFNREFYFRNSGCALALDVDFYVVEDSLGLTEVGTEDPYWLSPNDRVTRDYERACQALGRTPAYYSGLVIPYAWVNHPARGSGAPAASPGSETVTIRQAYGGGTLGIPAPWRHGKTTGFTSNPFPDRFSRQDWLFTHEFHHQLDALMDLSGFAAYYHADEPWKMPGRFGEDFDFNARIIRNAERAWWEALSFGTLEAAGDRDRDGVPDDDPSLPFDERRTGSSPLARDADGDGLTDLAEVMAGTSRGTDPARPDTDLDGLDDGHDPEPLCPVAPLIHRAGRTPETTFLWSDTPGLDGRVSMVWDDAALSMNVETDSAVHVLIQVDALCDGWFHGFDNFQIRIDGTRDTARVIDYYLRDCSSWSDPPKDRKDILSMGDLGVGVEHTADTTRRSGIRHTVTVRIPRRDDYGFNLTSGKKIALRLGLQRDADRWVWHELFERNMMMPLELQ